MKLSQVREDVIETSKKLLYSGLVARTWGNVSRRLDGNHFVITPSGRDYESLRREDIVIMNISDGRSWGTVRPSSEKGVHLAGYRDCDDVGFIIHTHQTEASVISAYEKAFELPVEGIASLEPIPCAAYGFPGTAELSDNVAAAFDKGRCRVVLMAHHGAVCFGREGLETLRIASELEVFCTLFIRRAFERYIGRPSRMDDPVYELLLSDQGAAMPRTVVPLLNSERQGDAVIFHLRDGSSALMDELLEERPEGTEIAIHRAIYESRPDIGAIRHSVTPATVAVSALGGPLGAYLDDFAQINGVTMEEADLTAESVAAALGNRHGVLLTANGALCCGKTAADAEAHAIVTEKNARTRMFAPLFPDRPLNTLDPDDGERMRRFYLESYAARFDER